MIFVLLLVVFVNVFVSSISLKYFVSFDHFTRDGNTIEFFEPEYNFKKAIGYGGTIEDTERYHVWTQPNVPYSENSNPVLPRVDLPLAMPLNNYAVLFWFRMDADDRTTDPRLITQGGNAAQSAYEFQVAVSRSSNRLRLRAMAANGSGVEFHATSSSAISLNRWYFVAVTKVAAQLQLLLDSSVVIDESFSSNLYSTEMLSLGSPRQHAFQHFPGKLDDVRIFTGMDEAARSALSRVYEAPRLFIAIEPLIQHELVCTRLTLLSNQSYTMNTHSMAEITLEQITNGFCLRITTNGFPNQPLISADIQSRQLLLFRDNIRFFRNRIDNPSFFGVWLTTAKVVSPTPFVAHGFVELTDFGHLNAIPLAISVAQQPNNGTTSQQQQSISTKTTAKTTTAETTFENVYSTFSSPTGVSGLSSLSSSNNQRTSSVTPTVAMMATPTATTQGSSVWLPIVLCVAIVLVFGFIVGLLYYRHRKAKPDKDKEMTGSAKVQQEETNQSPSSQYASIGSLLPEEYVQPPTIYDVVDTSQLNDIPTYDTVDVPLRL